MLNNFVPNRPPPLSTKAGKINLLISLAVAIAVLYFLWPTIAEALQTPCEYPCLGFIPVGMLVAIIGNPGVGKTLLLTKFAIDSASKKRPVYSNYGIYAKYCEKIDAKKFLDLNESINALCCLDELYVWFDSRSSGTRWNKQMGKVFLQSRKRGLDVIYTVQLDSTVDKRLRELCDFKIYGLPPGRKAFKYALLHPWKRKPVFFNLPFNDAKKLFKKYDTREIVELEAKAAAKDMFGPVM